MNRFNYGNVATNAVQTLAVSGLTASHEIQNAKRRQIDNAASALNNLSKEDLERVGQMRAGKLMDEVEAYENSKKETVDDIIGGNDGNGNGTDVSSGGAPQLNNNSEQVRELQTSMDRKVQWLEDRHRRLSEQFDTMFGKKNITSNAERNEFIKTLREEYEGK